MMTAGTSVSSRSAATKRLMKEYAELQSSPNYQYTAAPLEDNMFDWHFTIRGPEDSEFENGIYHGRIVLPPQYPYKPPSIYFLTPNGRFELGKKICLSITGYHPETWLPAWGIRTALIALISFMTTEGKDAIGALDYTPEERRILAKKSQSWHCQQCGCKNCEQLLPIPKKESKSDEDDKKLAEMLVVSHDKKESNSNSDSENSTNDNITPIEDVNKNNNNENILTSDNNNNNNIINSTLLSTESISTLTPNINISNTNINTNPLLNQNTNSMEVNTSSIQQRKSMNSSTSSIANLPAISSSSNTTPSSSSPNVANSPTSTTSSQTNLNNNNNNNNKTTTVNPQTNNNNSEERFKSLIDTAIIIVFSLLAFLLYYRSTKDTKFWNDLE